MAHLPSVGWADVATKRDLDVLKGGLDHLATTFGLKLEAMKAEVIGTMRQEFHSEIRSLHSEIRSSMRNLFIGISSMVISLAAIAFAAARLT